MVVTLQAVSRLGYAYRRLKRVSRQNAALDFNVDLLLSEVLKPSIAEDRAADVDDSPVRCQTTEVSAHDGWAECSEEPSFQAAECWEECVRFFAEPPCPLWDADAGDGCARGMRRSGLQRRHARFLQSKGPAAEVSRAEVEGHPLVTGAEDVAVVEAVPVVDVVTAGQVEEVSWDADVRTPPGEEDVEGNLTHADVGVHPQVTGADPPECTEDGAVEGGPTNAVGSDTESSDIWQELQPLQESGIGDQVILELQRFLCCQPVTEEDMACLQQVRAREHPEEELMMWMAEVAARVAREDREVATVAIQIYWREFRSSRALIAESMDPLSDPDVFDQAVACLSFTKLRVVREVGRETNAWWWFCLFTIGLCAEAWEALKRPNIVILACAMEGLLNSVLRIIGTPEWLRHQGVFPKRLAGFVVRTVHAVRRNCYRSCPGSGKPTFLLDAGEKFVRRAERDAKNLKASGVCDHDPVVNGLRTPLEQPAEIRAAARQAVRHVVLREAKSSGMDLSWDLEINFPERHSLLD